MYIDRQRGFGFVHIPKTAGTSVLAALGVDMDHAAPHPIPEYSSDLDILFRFAFVRNPWDRALSAFRYTLNMVDRGNIGKHVVRQEVKDKECRTFDQFAREILSVRVLRTSPHFRPQHRWLSAARVSFIGRVETIEADFARVAFLLGVDAALPKSNVTSSGEHYSTWYTDETRHIVAKLYAKDISLLGYKFEDMR